MDFGIFDGVNDSFDLFKIIKRREGGGIILKFSEKFLSERAFAAHNRVDFDFSWNNFSETVRNFKSVAGGEKNFLIQFEVTPANKNLKRFYEKNLVASMAEFLEKNWKNFSEKIFCKKFGIWDLAENDSWK